MNNIITNNFVKGKRTTGHNGAKGGGIVNHFNKVIISKNIISDNELEVFGTSDAYGAGISLTSSANGSLISNNTITNNSIAGNITSAGGGISILDCTLPIINNIIGGNSAQNGGGIRITNSASKIINNTIVNNLALSNGGGLYANNSNPRAFNNILWDNQAGNGAGIYPSNLPNVRFSDIQGINNYPGQGNINDNPMFSDSTLYELSDSSKCIGWGADSVQISGTWYYAPNVDYDGDPRPNPVDNYVDMGAQESDFLINRIGNEDFYNFPNSYSLNHNYPNPFNPSTKIKYTLQKSEKVKIEIFNLLGQKITTLINKQMPAGSHEVEFTARELSSGVYLYRIEAGEYQQTRKMIILR